MRAVKRVPTRIPIRGLEKVLTTSTKAGHSCRGSMEELIISMPMTGSVATGFGLGFVSYVLIRLCTGRAREVNPVLWIISACFIVNFVLR